MRRHRPAEKGPCTFCFKKITKRQSTKFCSDECRYKWALKTYIHHPRPGPEILFWRHVDKSAGEDGCWLWKSKKIRGYGYFRIHKPKKVDVSVHRYSYKMAYGEIPAGLQIDHLCSVRHCVQPKHLEAVTCLENNRRSWARGRHKKTLTIETKKG